MIATALGVFLVLAPKAALCTLGVWAAVIALYRYVSPASIIAAAGLPVLIAVFGYPWSCTFFAAFAAAVAIYKHRSNIRRLLDGTEHRKGRLLISEHPAAVINGTAIHAAASRER